MATIKTSGLNSKFDDYDYYGYDSASELNYFLDDEAFGAASTGASAVGKFSAFFFGKQLFSTLNNIDVSLDGKTAVDEDGLSIVGKNLSAVQSGKGIATINKVTSNYEGTTLNLEGSIVVSSQGVANGTITSASYFVNNSGCGDNDTLVSFTGKAIIKSNALISQSFTTATVTTYSEPWETPANPSSENIMDSVTLTGNFLVGDEGPDGNVTGIVFIGDGDTQLNVTGIKGVKLSDILEDGFNKEFILSGADTITAVYTDRNGYEDRGISVFSHEDSRGAVLEGYAGSDTLNGGDRDDDLYGGTDNDTLRGNGGHDYLDGGKGADRLFGGAGNDFYVVDNAKDLITEATNAGNDFVDLEFSVGFNSYRMANNVENAYVGYAQSDVRPTIQSLDFGYDNVVAATVTGNSLDNLIVGNIGSDTLNGEGGNDLLIGGYDYYDYGFDEDTVDTLNGGKGNDVLNGGEGTNVLTGGADADLFVFDPNDDGSTDTRITDFKTRTDKLVLELDYYNYGYNSVDPLALGDTINSGNALYDEGRGSSVTLRTLDASDFTVTSDFDSDAEFTESGVYYDTGDKQVWYVEVTNNYGYSGGSGISDVEVYLIATLDGNVPLRAGDIAIATYDYSGPIGI